MNAIARGHVPGLRSREVDLDTLVQDRYPDLGPEAEEETDGGTPGPGPDQGAQIADAGLGTQEVAVAPDLVVVMRGVVAISEATADPLCPAVEDILVTGVTRRLQKNLKKIQRPANVWEYSA